VAEGEIVSL